MREILFRGKRIDNGEWVEGLAVRFHVGTGKVLPTGYVPPELKLHIQYRCDNRYLTAAEVDPATVGQWTGLCDKNGVKIFEGDILKEDKSRFAVQYEQQWGKFKLQHMDAIQYPEWNRGVNMIVIGTIHDKEG